MPDFGAVTPVVTAQGVSWTMKGLEGEKARRSISEIGTGVTDAEITAMAVAIGQVSNAGLWRYTGNGKTTEIPEASVTVYDDAHGMGTELILTFQRGTDLDVRQVRIVAPDAALFDNGVVLKAQSDAEQGTRITNLITTISTVMNKGATGADIYGFQSGYLDKARGAEKRVLPVAANIQEPPAGTPSEGPGDDPTP